MIELRRAVGFIDLEDQGYWHKIENYLMFKGTTAPYHTHEEKVLHISRVASEYKEKIRQYQKQQTAKDMFVGPEKPNEDDYALHTGDYIIALQQWENWQPVFVNEDGMALYDREATHHLILKWLDTFTSIDEFIYGCTDNPFWNPDHGTVKSLYYVDK